MTDSVESVLQKSREEFEKELVAFYSGFGNYASNETEFVAWQFWQASRSALEPMLAELTKLREDSEVLRYTDTILTQHYGHTVSIGKVLEDLEAAEQALREAQADATKFGELWDKEIEMRVAAEAENEKLRESRSQPWGRERELREDREKLRELLRETADRVEHEGDLVHVKAGMRFRPVWCLKCRAEEALSPSPTPAQDFIWTCSACRMRIQTVIKFHVNQRPVCVQCNAEMEPAKPSPDSPAPLPHKVEYLRAKEPGLCIICAARIHTGELIHIGGSGGVPVAAHHECVQTNHADAQKYNMLGGHSS